MTEEELLDLIDQAKREACAELDLDVQDLSELRTVLGTKAERIRYPAI